MKFEFLSQIFYHNYILMKKNPGNIIVKHLYYLCLKNYFMSQAYSRKNMYLFEQKRRVFFRCQLRTALYYRREYKGEDYLKCLNILFPEISAIHSNVCTKGSLNYVRVPGEGVGKLYIILLWGGGSNPFLRNILY